MMRLNSRIDNRLAPWYHGSPAITSPIRRLIMSSPHPEVIFRFIILLPASSRNRAADAMLMLFTLFSP